MSKRKKTNTPTEVADTAVVSEDLEDVLEQAPLAEADVSLDVAALQAELEHAQETLEQQRDLFVRAKAEADNIRKRAENDLRNARKFAVEDFAAETLAVRDSLELARAVEINGRDAGALEKMQEGLDLTLRQLDNVFSKFSIEVVDPSPGDKLNPEQHQAMSIVESAEIPPNHIVAVMQKGYLLHDRLIRPAMVIVAKAAAPDAGESAT